MRSLSRDVPELGAELQNSTHDPFGEAIRGGTAGDIFPVPAQLTGSIAPGIKNI